MAVWTKTCIEGRWHSHREVTPCEESRKALLVYSLTVNQSLLHINLTLSVSRDNSFWLKPSTLRRLDSSSKLEEQILEKLGSMWLFLLVHLCYCNKHLRQSIYMDARLIWAHYSQEFSPYPLGPAGLGLRWGTHSRGGGMWQSTGTPLMSRKQKDEGEGPGPIIPSRVSPK